jgi:hypothetical protein
MMCMDFRFSDRDLVMRYRGMGVGHAGMHYDPNEYESRVPLPTEAHLEDLQRPRGSTSESEGSVSDSGYRTPPESDAETSYTDDVAATSEDGDSEGGEDLDDVLAGGGLGADGGELNDFDEDDPNIFGFAAE